MPRLSKIGAAALAAFGWTGLSSVTADFLVIAGGGGSGGALGGNYAASGGGGAGGYRTSAGTSGGGASAEGKLSLNPTLSYTVIVGAGGTGVSAASNNGGNGSDSTFSTITSVGGGGSGSSNNNVCNGAAGGSGGASAGRGPATGGAGTANQGFKGGDSSTNQAGAPGGGGAGSAGVDFSGVQDGTNGGNGVSSSITGSAVSRAGGGGGGAGSGTGGSGQAGGGNGSIQNINGTNGTANTGGGAGGAGSSVSNATSGGNGGSGVVIISYVGAQQFGGGVVTSSGGNTIHTFTTSGTLSPLNSLTASYLIVAGGGGGGGGNGGGGAGGLLSGSGLTIDTNSIYAVTVGAGGTAAGASRGGNGGNSSFSMVSTAAVGGGGGGVQGGITTGANGGSGGGGSYDGSAAGGTGTAGQGTNGGSGAFAASQYGGGGGGGKTSAGSNGTSSAGGNGGAGLANPITGSTTGQLDSGTYYLAGGGGGGANTASAGTGGLGGGGAGGINSGVGTAGTANTGGGGGGGATTGAANFSGGVGGSGVVIISYPGSTQQMAGGTVTVAGGNVIHTFTSSGYLTPIVLVNNSLRFRSSVSAYLNRTPASAATSRRIMTYSVWAKIGTLGTQRLFYEGYTSVSDFEGLVFNTSNQLEWTAQVNGGTSYGVRTPAVFRDPSAWYHIVCSVDTTQATDTNRVRIYVNGVEQTGLTTFYSGFPAQNTDLEWNNQSSTQVIGWGGHFGYYDGYMTEINMIDGQALTPNSFGTSNGLGVWQPIRYGGSYGTNGFYLPFINNATGTSLSANFLVVAGGAGGGEYWSGGGGGAGGLRSSVTNTGGGGSLESALTINTNSTYLVTVGGGGPGAATGGSGTKGTNGSNSVFSTVTSTGGGAGGLYGDFNGNSGGSGGGGFYGGSGGAGTANQGFAGGAGASSGFGNESGGGGGGGAGAVGAAGAYAVGGNGGAGVSVAITGSSVPYAGGGGGSVYTGTGGTGGSGGGANGVANGGGNGNNGSPNTGGGASGTATYTLIGGNGGSGVVIISYAGDAKFTGGTITRSGGNTIHTFTSSGVLTSVFSDYSPNGNNWTGNNFDVTNTTASTYDSMTDVPTLTSATVANYCTWNPINRRSTVQIKNTLDGNLNVSGDSNQTGIIFATIYPTTGKWYYEFSPANTYANSYIGCGNTSENINQYPGNSTNSVGLEIGSGRVFSSSLLATYTGISAGEIGMIAWDCATGKVWMGRQGTWFNSGDPAAGTGQVVTLTAGEIGPMVTPYLSSGVISTTFGQRPFSYTPPTGFLQLNTFNLPTPTIGATPATTANKYFNANLYTGNGTTNAITNVGFQPDFVWVKSISDSYFHGLYDAVRGAGSTKGIYSNDPVAEGTYSDFQNLVSFDSNGFTLGATSNTNNINANTSTFVGWNWKANGAGSTNTAGSIISTVSSNTATGFSIVTYTGNATSGATVGHGCQVNSIATAPSMVILKSRSLGTNFYVYHSGLTSAAYQVYLNLPSQQDNSVTTAFNSVAPGATTFTLPGTGFGSNNSGATYVAYCFAQVAGYSAFGTYIGNNDDNGPFIYTGFRPRWVMVKNRTSSQSWQLMDTSRSTYNVATANLLPNSSTLQLTGTDFIDILSNGFKIRRNSAGNWNNSGDTYLYVCFAENPFKYANAR